MADSIPIQSANGVEVGTIVFSANLDRLGVRKTASGADVEFPVVINLAFNSTADPQPLLTDVHAQITGVSEQRSCSPLGEADASTGSWVAYRQQVSARTSCGKRH